jgi:hypothetical protein
VIHEVLKDGPSERTLRCILPFEPFERSAAIERFVRQRTDQPQIVWPKRLEPAAVVEWLARGSASRCFQVLVLV